MKNKKLFAILTLVCFMFTLMPVAAFAASSAVGVEGKDGKLDQTLTVVEGTTTAGAIAVVLENADEKEEYQFVVFEGDELYDYEDATLNGDVFEATLNLKTALPGTYTVNAVVKGDIDGILGDDVLTDAEKAKLIQAKKSFVKDGLTIKVKADSAVKYTIKLKAVDGRDIKVYELKDGKPDTTKPIAGKYEMTINANGGWDEELGEVVATLERDGEAVDDEELTFSTAGYVDLTFEDGKVTDRGGDVEFEVTSDRAGEYKVIVKYGTKAKAELTVNVVAEEVAGVAVETAPKAPVDMEQEVKLHEIEFKFTDANGRAIAPTLGDEGDTKVLLTAKPADSTLEEDAFTLEPTEDDGVWVVAGEDFDAEGEYTFKVVLKNGKSAEVTVEAAEMGEVVGIKYDVYNTPRTVAYGEFTGVDKVLAYDKNGVTKNVAADAVFSANGVAVKELKEQPTKNGIVYAYLVVENDDDYIGETITVFAEYEDYVTSTTLTVVDKAANIAFGEATAEVGVNTEIKGNIVDSKGNMSSLTAYIGAASGNGLILEKPENAVAVATWDVDSKGRVVLDFLGSEAGTYKVQVAISYNTNLDPETRESNPNMKFVSGVATIVVGEGEGTFEDIVVVSIGADKMIVNSEVVALDVAPFITNGRTMMQFNVLYVFGIDVEWVAETQSIVAEGNGLKVVMQLGSKVATVNGEEVALDVAPYSVNGRTVVPVGFITGVLDITPTFTYNADGSIADILFTK